MDSVIRTAGAKLRLRRSQPGNELLIEKQKEEAKPAGCPYETYIHKYLSRRKQEMLTTKKKKKGKKKKKENRQVPQPGVGGSLGAIQIIFAYSLSPYFP